MVKNPPLNARDFVQSPGWEDTLEKKITTYYSILTQGVLLDRGPWKATFHETAKESDMA